MGIDAKGRNFSAPRLTPGKRQEFMTYGSPSMIKEQDRQIAIMEERARRYGYMSSRQAAQMGGYTARPLGTNEGYNRPPATAATSYARPAATRTASYANRTAANSEDAKKVVKFIIIFFIAIQLIPMLITFIVGLIGAAAGNL